MATVQALLRGAADLPGESARRDAEILLCHCLDKPRTWLYTWPDSEVSPAAQQQFTRMLAQRSQGTPVAYLTGQREFWSLPLAVDEHTLIPRPETETLVEWALQLPLPGNATVLDLGTGTGAVALAVASERPCWQVSAVDSSEQALAVARANARANKLQRVSFQLSNWYQGLAGQRFHLLVSNPPYIDPDDPHLGQGDVRFEPRSALVASAEGLADLTRLAQGAPAHILPGGWLLMEHGFEQGDTVRRLLREAGFGDVSTRCDMAGHERITGGCWHAQ